MAAVVALFLLPQLGWAYEPRMIADLPVSQFCKEATKDREECRPTDGRWIEPKLVSARSLDRAQEPATELSDEAIIKSIADAYLFQVPAGGTISPCGKFESVSSDLALLKEIKSLPAVTSFTTTMEEVITERASSSLDAELKGAVSKELAATIRINFASEMTKLMKTTESTKGKATYVKIWFQRNAGDKVNPIQDQFKALASCSGKSVFVGVSGVLLEGLQININSITGETFQRAFDAAVTAAAVSPADKGKLLSANVSFSASREFKKTLNTQFSGVTQLSRPTFYPFWVKQDVIPVRVSAVSDVK
ncbi:hypothetical protein KRR26_35945 [Corallococcus sp. M34]|uniref:hypothetical protein n=1 Tax=Citreicoccus inhibens TaxID=2849499 RepID=UPI001C2151A6|nr:hypothetical protein [Citreicoccus inhibens]MBU8901001.1 hypothetical protein [Citreicoccus inhibens]